MGLLQVAKQRFPFCTVFSRGRLPSVLEECRFSQAPAALQAVSLHLRDVLQR